MTIFTPEQRQRIETAIRRAEAGTSAEFLCAVARSTDTYFTVPLILSASIALMLPMAIAHFTLGSVLRRLGDVEGARRSFRNVRDLCVARPAEEIVRFSDGEHAGTLARAAQLQLEGLNR